MTTPQVDGCGYGRFGGSTCSILGSLSGAEWRAGGGGGGGSFWCIWSSLH